MSTECLQVCRLQLAILFTDFFTLTRDVAHAWKKSFKTSFFSPVWAQYIGASTF